MLSNYENNFHVLAKVHLKEYSLFKTNFCYIFRVFILIWLVIILIISEFSFPKLNWEIFLNCYHNFINCCVSLIFQVCDLENQLKEAHESAVSNISRSSCCSDSSSVVNNSNKKSIFGGTKGWSPWSGKPSPTRRHIYDV